MKTTLLIPTLNEIQGMKVIMPQIDRNWVDQILIVDESGIALGQSQSSVFTCPANSQCFISRIKINVESSKSSRFILFQRQNADVTSAPFTSKRMVVEFDAVLGAGDIVFKNPLSFPAKHGR